LIIEKVTKRVVQCTDCEGTGEILDWFDSLLGVSSSMLRSCSTCEGLGVTTLQHKQCSCGRSEWMGKDYSTCSVCLEETIQDLVNLFVQPETS